MLCPQNRTAHCTSHTRAPQKPRHLFRSAVCPHGGLVLRTKGGKTEFCPHGGPALRTNGGRRRFFGNIYFTNRPLVACSAITPSIIRGFTALNCPGRHLVTYRLPGGIGKDREDSQQRAVPAAGWAGLLQIRSISCQGRPIFDQPGTSQRSSPSGITAMISPSYPAPML